MKLSDIFMTKVYDMDIESVITKRIESIKKERYMPNNEKEEILRTTVTLPQLIRIVMTNMKEENLELNWQEMTRIVVEHGFSIMEHRYGRMLSDIGKLRGELKYPEIKRVRNFLHDTKINVDRVDSPGRKGINVRKKLHGGIATMADRLAIEFSSLIRLCIYHSLSTSRILPEEVINESKDQIERFRYDLLEAKVSLMMFKWGENVWKEKKDMWMREFDDVEVEIKNE